MKFIKERSDIQTMRVKAIRALDDSVRGSTRVDGKIRTERSGPRAPNNEDRTARICRASSR